MVKAKRFLSLFLATAVSFGLITVPTFADNAIGNIKYTRGSTKITATVELDATEKSRILVVRSYDENGLMSEIKTAANAPADTVLSATVNAGVSEVRASVMDENGRSLTPDAVYNADSTDLKYIKINGNLLTDFSNDNDAYFYQLKGSSFEIEAVPMDAGSKTVITKDLISRKAKIAVVSALGHVRNISLTFYTEEAEKYMLSSVKYKIGDKEYEIPGFSPDITIYDNIEIPENTMTLTILPQSAGDIDVQVKNTAATEINGVTIGRYVNSSDAYFEYPRTAVGNVITVKNETATAKVTVKSGTLSTEYLFNFVTPKQPRILEWNYVGAEDDSEKPTFVGGCAVYNDNGTTISSDWGYSACHISKELVGGSCILIPGNNKSGGWWQTTTSGEYFNFKADRGCTVYVLSGANFNSSDWSTAGWTKVNSGTVPRYTGSVLGTSYDEELGDNSGLARRMRKDWNDYSSPAVYAGNIRYNAARSKDYRCIDPGIKETNRLVDDGIVYRNLKQAYKKHFEAGEEVKIFHTGNKSELGCIVFVVLKWDNEDNSLLFSSPIAEEAGISEVITEPLDDSSIKDVSYIFGVNKDSYDAEKGVWKNLTGKSDNDMTLGISSDSKWVENVGFKASAVSSGATTTLPANVQDILKSGNATLQFKLADFSGADGKFGIIFSNNDAKNMLCTKAKGTVADITNVDLRLNVGTTSNNVQPTGIDLTKINTIVFDKAHGKLYWYVDNDKKVDADFAYPDLSGIGNINLSYTGTGSNYVGSSATFEMIKVFNKALTAQEISELSDSSNTKTASSEKLKVNAQSENGTASVLVLNSGYTMDDVKTAAIANDSTELSKAVMYFSQQDAKDGKISMDIPMVSGSAEGNYTVIVDGKTLTASFAEDLTGKVSDYSNNIEYFADSVAYNSLSNKTKVQVYTKELLAGQTLSADSASVAKIKEAVKTAVLVEQLNEGKISDIEEIKEATELISPIIPLSELDKINAGGKKNIVTAINSKAFSSVADYKKALAAAMFINEINKDSTLLEAADKLTFFNTYAKSVGLNTSALSGKSAGEALAKLSAENVTTLTDMQNRLNSICASLPSQTPISSTGGGGGGGNVIGGVPVTNGANSGSAEGAGGIIPGVQFTDMDAYSWAKNAVQALKAKGIISGYEDMTFKPGNSVTRAEFITMMVKAYMPASKVGNTKFSDVSAGAWFFESVMTALENGIIKGVTENKFMPNNQIKRQDMAVILYNLATKLGKDADEETGEFADFDSVSDYAKNAVAFLKAAGVVKGDENGAFNPQSYANRAESAQMIYTFMDFVGEGVLK